MCHKPNRNPLLVECVDENGTCGIVESISMTCYLEGTARGIKVTDPTQQRNRESHRCGCPVVITFKTGDGAIPRIGKVTWQHEGHEVAHGIVVPAHD